MEPSFERDLASSPSLQGAIDDEHHWHIGGVEGSEHEMEKEAAEEQRRPRGMVEDAMIGGEMPVVLATNGPQGACHRPPPRCQQGSRQQITCMCKGRGGEGRSKRIQDGEQLDGDHLHDLPLGVQIPSSQPTIFEESAKVETYTIAELSFADSQEKMEMCLHSLL